MPSGRVRWFDANKGYGFIQNEQGADVFLPAAALPDHLSVSSSWNFPASCRRGCRVPPRQAGHFLARARK